MMVAFKILGEEVVTRSDWMERVQGGEIAQSVPAAKALAGLEGETVPGATQFQPIGAGKPLTILIREVYTGRHPKKGIFGGGGKQMLVTTALKDYATYAPSSRAVNFIENGIEPKKRMRAPMASSAGTNVVSYSPAVLSDQMLFTVEMAFDRFPDGLLNTISSAFGAAADMPLLLPARDYLLGAGAVVKLASDWGDALMDGRAAFSMTDSIDFNVPGVKPASADFRVLGSEEHIGLRYDPATGLTSKSGAPYDGDDPYVIVSLDGAERKSLENFAPTLATAEQLKRFLAAKDGAEASVDALLGGLKLANDMKFRGEAVRLQAEISAETDAAAKAGKQQRLDAVVRNILTPELRPA